MNIPCFFRKVSLLLLLCCLSATSFGQTAAAGNIDLKVGDEVPDIPIRQFLDNGSPRNTGDYKDRLLIVDFMATTCGNCILALPKMEELQKKYGNRIHILPVTYEDRELVHNFFSRNKLVKNLMLPIVVEDTVLAAHFKHKLLSHVVWINKGKVIAISGSEYVDQKTIDAVLSGEEVNIPLKDDFPVFNYAKPIFSTGGGNSAVASYSAVGPYIEGAKTTYGSERDSVRGSMRDYMVNVPVIQAYLYAMMQYRTLPYMKGQRIILEGLDKSAYIFEKSDSGYKADWDRAHAISYESLLPDTLDKKSRMMRIMADLDNKLGLHGRIEERSVKCWVIKKGNEKKAGLGDSKQPYSDFVFLLDLKKDIPPVIDESGYNGNIATGSWTDFVSLRRLLLGNGLDLIEEERKIHVFVLSRQ